MALQMASQTGLCVLKNLVFKFNRILSNKLDCYNRRCNVHTCTHVCVCVCDPVSWTG